MEFGETGLAHLPEAGKGSGNPAPTLADRLKSGVWLGKSDLTDEHLVLTDDEVVFCAKCTTTRREQLVRREPQVSHRERDTEVDGS